MPLRRHSYTAPFPYQRWKERTEVSPHFDVCNNLLLTLKLVFLCLFSFLEPRLREKCGLWVYFEQLTVRDIGARGHLHIDHNALPSMKLKIPSNCFVSVFSFPPSSSFCSHSLSLPHFFIFFQFSISRSKKRNMWKKRLAPELVVSAVHSSSSPLLRILLHYSVSQSVSHKHKKVRGDRENVLEFLHVINNSKAVELYTAAIAAFLPALRVSQRTIELWPSFSNKRCKNW